MKKSIFGPLAIFLAALLSSLFFILAFDHPLIQDDDAGQYDAIGWNLAQGKGFSLSLSRPYIPTMMREPAYPIFLAVLYKTFGHHPMAVQIAQAILFGLTCLLVYSLAKNLFNKRVALYSGLLTAIIPTLANYPSYILSETLFTLLLSISIYCLTMAIIAKKSILFALSGACCGIMVLCKAIMLPFFAVVLLGIVLIDRSRRISFKKIAVSVIAFILPLVLVTGSWGYRNYQVFGTYRISLRGGAALWEMSQKLDDPPEDMKRAIVSNFSEYLGNKLFPHAVENARDFILQGSKRSHEKEMQFKRAGLSDIEIDNIMRREAVKKIRSKPARFLSYIPVEMIKMTAFIYVPTLNEPYMIERFSKIKNGDTFLSLIRAVFRLSAYPFLALAMIGFFFEMKRWKEWFFIAGAIIYINIIYSMVFAMGRYAVALVPFYCIFAVLGILKLFSGIRPSSSV